MTLYRDDISLDISSSKLTSMTISSVQAVRLNEIFAKG